MSQIDTKIGPKIKAFRRQLGIQANKLAEEMSISPSYLNLIESGKRKIDGDLLLRVCDKLKIELSDLTSRTDINLENNISELLGDELFEDLDILGPEVKDLVNTNPKIAKALIKLGDNFKQKDHEIFNKLENISGKIIDGRKNAFPGEVISDFLQENKNFFPKLEGFANNIFDINSVKVLYALPEKSFTLVADEKDDVYLVKILKINKKKLDDKEIMQISNEVNEKIKNEIYSSYDIYLNNEYKVEINDNALERVNNFFK